MNEHLHILFAPLLPYRLLAALGVAALLLCGFAFYRRAKGALGRALLFALILLALANPSLIGETREALQDRAIVAIDDSASMKLGKRSEQAAQAADAVAKKLAEFSDLTVETVHVTGDDETDLFHAIEEKRASIPADRLAGVIAITDGEVHDKPSGNFAAPFHALIAGQKNEIDRRIIVKSAPAYGIVGQKATLTLRVEDEPKAQSEKAGITMTRDDGSNETIMAPVGQDVQVDVTVKHAGANIVAFEAEPLPNELTPINNVATASINGIRDRLRVLLISGQPHIGGRNWRNLLKADPAVDLIHFTILRSPFKDNTIPNTEMALIAFPAKELFETKLKDFDLVIFDGFGNRLLFPDSYLANIASYVENGGALLITHATGAQAAEVAQTPLASILPTSSRGDLLSGAFVPALTDAGKRHPVTATLGDVEPRNLWSPWYGQADAEPNDRSGEVLLTGLNQKPLLVLSHVGKGRVAQFLSNQFWLWARDYPQGGPEAELLRRTAHWLVSEPELDETALRAHAEKSADGWQIVIAQQSLHGDTANVVVTGTDNQPVQVKLTRGKEAGILAATLPAKTVGLYHIKDDAHEILVMAGAQNSPEFGAMIATEDNLAPVAKASGGDVVWLADHPDGPEIRRTNKGAAQSGWGWIGLRKNGQYRVTGSSAVPLWPAWAALAVLLLAAMWVWRREGRG